MGFFPKKETPKKMVKKVVKKVEPKVVAPIQAIAEVEEISSLEQDEIEEEVVEEKENKWSIGEIATATQPVIYNSETKEQLTLHEAIVEILNRTE